ncbi:TonB-dependent receptor [Sphingobacterium sp. MYb382]|uniref:TonB-dependent receptor n=1 Tax=Sphingobacterium sp. MYb382 TaxID=2745278 RepID=UPI0030A5BBCC
MWKLLILFMLMAVDVLAQQSIGGKVLNQEGKPIAGGSILLKMEDKILRFTRTNDQGEFALSYDFQSLSKAAVLEFNHIAYEKQSVAYDSKLSYYNITSAAKVRQIEEVYGKAVPIRQKGDTLVYQVGAFADSIDRSIGDVLSRMPGFAVSDAGKISYNGQSISQLMVDGDDLFGNKYGVGTNNIKADIISAVEVYRNHQPIKALKDRISSNDVAINLKVKSGAAAQWLATVSAAAGLPKQYLLEVHTTRFKASFKSLNSLFLNNIGKDVKEGMQDLGGYEQGANLSPYYLRNGINAAAELPSSNFYDNRGIALLSNHFLKLGKEWNIRANLGLSADKKLLSSSFRQDYLLSDENLFYLETAQLTSKPFDVDFRLSLLKNVERNYFVNNLNVQYGRVNTANEALTGVVSVWERLLQERYVLLNDLQFVPNGKSANTWRFNWKTKLDRSPENLKVISSEELPILLPFELSGNPRQDVRKSRFETSLSANYMLKPWKNIQQSYGVVLEIDHQQLDAKLQTDNEGAIRSPFNFVNDLNWDIQRVKTLSTFSYTKRKSLLSLKVPLGWQGIGYKDEPQALKSRKDLLLFTPRLDFNYRPVRNHRFLASLWREQKVGEISDVFAAYIMNSFRSVQKSASTLPYSRTHNLIAFYSIESPQKMLFVNVNYNWSREFRNVISSVQADSVAEQLGYISGNNSVTSQTVNADISKYLNFLRATSSLGVSFNDRNSTRLFNGESYNYVLRNYLLKPTLAGRLVGVQWKYVGSLQWNKGHQRESIRVDEGYISQHNLSLSYTYRSRAFLTLRGNSMYLKNNGNEFSFLNADGTIRYKLNKKMDYEFTMQNIFNQKDFSTYHLYEGTSVNQSYRLRGRMAFLKVNWSF